jgi:hypothetical protein
MPRFTTLSSFASPTFHASNLQLLAMVLSKVRAMRDDGENQGLCMLVVAQPGKAPHLPSARAS